MTLQYVLLVFGYLFVGGTIGLIYIYSAGKDPINRRNSLYSIWPMVIGLLGFIVVALWVR